MGTEDEVQPVVTVADAAEDDSRDEVDGGASSTLRKRDIAICVICILFLLLLGATALALFLLCMFDHRGDAWIHWVVGGAGALLTAVNFLICLAFRRRVPSARHGGCLLRLLAWLYWAIPLLTLGSGLSVAAARGLGYEWEAPESSSSGSFDWDDWD